MNRKRWLMAAGGALIAVVLGVGMIGTAFAAGSATPTSQSGATGRAQQFLDKLASNLGITSDQLQTGLKTTEKQDVAQAVQNGKLTQDQADVLNEKIDASNGVGPLARFLHLRHRVQLSVGTAVANAIGITPAELKSELQSGKTLQQVITDHGKTATDVVNAVVAQAKAKLDPKVQSGKITQQQETNFLNNLQQRLTNRINNPSNPAQPAQPSATPAA